MKKLIYAVDDEESIRELYKYALNNAEFECICFPDGKKLFESAETVAPDLFILDIMLEGVDGYGILEQIRADSRLRDCAVIMVSAKTEELSKVKGLDMGADDYVSKPFGILELLARVKANLRKRAAKTELSTYRDVKIDESKHTVSIADEEVDFTLKEYEILKLLVANANNVVERDTLFDKVWGGDFMGETRTLDIHIKEIRRKIEKSQTEIITVRGVGYKLI